jgi:hypothetical protein
VIRRFALFSAVGITGCLLTTDLSGLSGGTEGDSGVANDAAPDAATDSPDVPDSGSDASSCTCTGLVSAYRFSDPNSLGHDFFGKNDMTSVKGAPRQSSTTPPGLGGHSIKLDGSSTVCGSGFTFDPTSDHTLCWWSQPAALANNTNQFAQTCTYDTWTASAGVDYLWRINNCNSGTPADLQVRNVYTVGNWVQICQTYKKASLTRSVVIDGKIDQKTSITDTVPIAKSTSGWCIGAYEGGGYWTGLVYLPMWFDRVIDDSLIQQISTSTCCLP